MPPLDLHDPSEGLLVERFESVCVDCECGPPSLTAVQESREYCYLIDCQLGGD